MSQAAKRNHVMYEADRDERRARRRSPRVKERTNAVHGVEEGTPTHGQVLQVEEAVTTTDEQAEMREIARSMARSFAATIDFYKRDYGGSLTHVEAVGQTIAMQANQREWVHGKDVKKIDWTDLAAVGAASLEEAMTVWLQIQEAAEDALESGARAAAVAGDPSPYELAQFLAIRNSFADQWSPQGGIESAMIDMMAVAFSLQMYWSRIAHQRATREHDTQSKTLREHENNGWKAPFQREADAVDQAHRLTDGYNRQFLRVLRQLRDLRRYMPQTPPPVIVNNGGQVNVAGQQVNVNKG
jgi:hypothetical protein